MEVPSSAFNPLPPQYITRFKEILDHVDVDRRRPNEESEKSFVEKKRLGLNELISKVRDPPKLTVAVHGDTGSGKSSLLNAILDEPNLVPTAGMGKACTSVAIRIEENDKLEDGGEYAAEIEFLTKTEWERELKVLTGDLTDTDIAEGESNSATSESAEAMMMAVYREFDKTNHKINKIIKTENEVTAKLGLKLVIKKNEASLLQDELLKYVDSSEDEEGGRYWPILKEVTIKLPKSELCRSGTVLIDLPGVGDANPARDRVAKKYVQSCDVMLVVAKIPRAVDNKTAETVLGERMMCKVKMDRRRTVLVCTQADVITPQEIIRKLRLPEAVEWTAENQRLTEKEKDLQTRLRQLKGESEKTPALFKEEASIYQALETVKGKKDQLKKEKNSRCAVARSEYVKRNMMKKELAPSESDYETMEVFCVSSKDYHKLSGLDDDDDQPAVFMTTEQTEIPNLRNFLKRASEEKRELRRNDIKCDFQSLVTGLHTYLTNMEHGGQKELKDAVERNLQTFESQTREIIANVDKEFETLLDGNLGTVLAEAVRAAEEYAPMACINWSKPVNRNYRRAGGLASNTYRATVSRDGEYYSSRIGIPISMNCDLCDPFIRNIATVWAKIFKENFWKDFITDNIRTRFSQAMDTHTKEVLNSVEALGHDVKAISTNINQLRTDAGNKLHRLDNIWYLIQERSREITGSIANIIQSEMEPAYSVCKEKTGPGSFQDIKSTMAGMIEHLKTTMFQNLKEHILSSLDDIKNEVVNEVNYCLMTICEDHRNQIEPLWQEQGGADFFQNVRRCREEIATLKDKFEMLDRGTKRNVDGGDIAVPHSSKKVKVEPTNEEVRETIQPHSRHETLENCR